MKNQEVNRDYYAYEHVEEALNAWSNRMNSAEVTRAIRKLKFMVLGYAWVDFCMWRKENENRTTLSWAWEDLTLALSGYGQSSMTGTVIDLWTATPKDQWDDLRKVLNTAVAKAEAHTSGAVARRYLKKYRGLAVRSPQDGFDLPCLVPVFGSRLQEWASKMGMDPDATEEQMRMIEEYERLGLIDIGGEIKLEQTAGGVATVLPAPEQLQPAAPPPQDNVISFSPKPRKR